MSLSRLLLVKASRLSRRRAMTENCNWKIRTGSQAAAAAARETAAAAAQLYNQILGRIRRISVALAVTAKANCFARPCCTHECIISQTAAVENSYTIIIICTRVANIPRKSW